MIRVVQRPFLIEFLFITAIKTECVSSSVNVFFLMGLVNFTVLILKLSVKLIFVHIYTPFIISMLYVLVMNLGLERVLKQESKQTKYYFQFIERNPEKTYLDCIKTI